MKPNRHLVIFAKAPKLGAVKTRLAAGIGDEAALEFYQKSLKAVLARLATRSSWRCWISVTPDAAVIEAPFWPDSYDAIPQGGGDLGDRMAKTFEVLPPGPVALIGADIPTIESTHIEAAFTALNDHDTVFGPAADGGYWLVGSNRSFDAAGMFKNVRWSSPHALADTLINVVAQGKSSAQLETLEDIDDRAAYQKWLTNVPSGAA